MAVFSPQTAVDSDDSLKPAPSVRALEVQTLVIAVGVGLWLGCAQSFSHSTGPIYHYMRATGEWTWAAALLLGAFLSLLGIGTGGLWMRKLGLMLVSLVWFLMTVCFVAGNPYAFTTWTYTVLAVSAGYASLRLQR